MTESILLKYDTPVERDILFSPRNGEEMMKAVEYKAPIIMYSDLSKIAEKIGPVRTIAAMFKRSMKNIILLQNPNNMQTGHWFSVSCNPSKKEIYFFSTYGGKPDVEKISWISKNDLQKSKQTFNIFNDGLKIYQNHGWTIHYNDYPFQKRDDNTAFCGIYTAAFLRCNKNPDDFVNICKCLIERKINPAIYFFNKYFH